jgi:hypothetical protein
MLRFNGAGLYIDIHQCVQLIQHNVNIIGANSCGNDSEAFFADIAGIRHEFPVLYFELYGIKITADLGYAIRITNRYDGGRQLLRAQIKVIYSAAGIKDEFRFWYTLHHDR